MTPVAGLTWFRWQLPVLTFAFSCIVTVTTAVFLKQQQAKAIRSANEAAINVYVQAIQDAFLRYEYGLRGARGIIVVLGDSLSRRGFLRYSATRDYSREFPGARGFGYIARVAVNQEHEFLLAARLDGKPDFTIRQFTPHANERFVIQYVEPAGPNAQAIGLDIASESRRRSAALAASASGTATLTAPITLVQAGNKVRQSFLMLLPVADKGWVYAPLITEEVLAALPLGGVGGRLALSDVTDAGSSLPFYQSPDRSLSYGTTSAEHRIFGRVWRFEVTPTPDMVARLNFVPITYWTAGGLAGSLVLAMLAAVWSASLERKRSLAAEQSKLAAIVSSSIDAMIGATLDGVITSWNRAAEDIFGYHAGHAVGRSLLELLVPPELAVEEADLLRRVGAGERIPTLRTRRRCRDGSEVWVSLAIAPIRNGQGKVIGASKTARDITTLVDAEQRLQEFNADLERQVLHRTAELESARHALRTVLDAVPSMIGYWDKHLINREANLAYHAFFGAPPNSLPGTAMRDLLGDALFESNWQYVQAALHGQAQRFERTLTAADGTPRHSLAHYLPDIVDGRVVGFYSFVHDVTDLVESRVALANAIRENAALVRTINQQMLYSVTDARGIIIEVNDNFCRASDLTRDQLIGQDHRIVQSGVHDDDYWRALWSTISAGQAWHGQMCNRTRSGQLVWFDTVIAPFFGENDNIERYVALRTDISARVRGDAELRRLSTLLSNVLRAASEMSMIATDPEGIITLFNAGAERMLGYSAHEMVGLATPACLHDPNEVALRAAELSTNYGTLISGFQAFVYESELLGSDTREWTYVRKDGSTYPVLLTVTPIRDEAGGLFGHLGVGIDIRQRKQDEQTLLYAKQTAEQASRAKGLFLANMSHEIRTPMNAVLGMLQLMQHTALDERQRDYLHKARTAGTTLLNVLNDVLDFSKIEGGKVELDVHEFSLDRLFDDLAAVLSDTYREAEVNLMFDIGEVLPLTVCGDSLRLLQVLVNLTSNAVKFTKAGSITVRLAATARSATHVELQFSVRDTGIGIEADQLTNIFSSFVQAESSTTRRFGGTGLGLAISKELVSLMGGSLEVCSQPGVGSQFSFALDLGLVPGTTAREQTAAFVLVVDDEPGAGHIMATLLRSLGAAAEVVTTESRFPHAVLESARRPEFSHVLISGAAWRAFRNDAGPFYMRNAVPFDTPLLVVAGSAASGAFEVPVNARPICTTTLSPPITRSALMRALQSAVAEVNVGKLPSVFARRRLAQLRILLVEDNLLNQHVAREMLALEGAAVDVAGSGAAAVALARFIPCPYDIILMDIQMPEMDGFEATKLIRQHGGFAALIPIIAMTANASEEDRASCLAAGMDEHVGKPIDFEMLVGILCAACPPTAAEQETDAAVDDVVDPTAALARLGGQVAVYRRVLGQFASESLDLCGEFKSAVIANQVDAATSALHTLKSIAAMAGALSLARTAGREEDQLRLTRHLPSPAAVALIDRQLSHAVACLERELDRLPMPMALPSPKPSLEVLAQLLGYLESGNMRALELGQQMTVDEPLAQLFPLIDKLAFAEAAVILRQYLRMSPQAPLDT